MVALHVPGKVNGSYRPQTAVNASAASAGRRAGAMGGGGPRERELRLHDLGATAASVTRRGGERAEGECGCVAGV